MRNTLFLMMSIFVGAHCFAQGKSFELETLRSYAAERPNWEIEVSDIAYISARCTVISYLVGAWVIDNSAPNGDTSIGTELINESKVTQIVAMGFGLKSGMSVESMIKRHKSFLEIYSERMRSNKSIFNNFTRGEITEDLQFCRGSHKYFIALSNKS